jgi:hypothetical protein
MKHIPSYENFLNESDDADMKAFKTKLDNHDWYYMMSDDNRAYTRGSAEATELSDLINKIGKKAEDLYIKMYKKKFPDSKYTPKILKNENDRYATFAEVKNMR